MTASDALRVGVVGGSGYAGGELIRLLLTHPGFLPVQVTSERSAGRFLHSVHPHLRSFTDLKFRSSDQLEPCDVLALCLPHGRASERIEEFAGLAERIVDLSADFRLGTPDQYRQWYGEDHANPSWLQRFVYGLPEWNRDAIRGAHHVSGVGCNATAATLALLPFAGAGLIDPDRPPVVDLKVGSSEGGNTHSASSHHPVRSGTVRSFAPLQHRHAAEVHQALAHVGQDLQPDLSVTSVELVRGAVATAQVWLRDGIDDKACWKLFRDCYGDEPFVRIVKERRGVHRYPEPRVVSGTNLADVGFAADGGRRVVSICAIDNLGKGAAGTALQCMNLMCGLEETSGLGQIPQYP